MPVGAYCQRNPVTAQPDESVREVAKRMDALNVGCVVVVDLGDRPVGLLTDRDIALRAMRRRMDLDTTPIRDVMNRDVTNVREAAPVTRALRRMRSDGIRRVAVVNDEGKLSGIITWDDALQVVSAELAAAAAVAATQMNVGAPADAPAE